MVGAPEPSFGVSPHHISPPIESMRRPSLFAVVGWAHLLGGAFGLAGLTVLSGPYRATWPGYWYVAGGALYALSVASGVALLRRRPAGPRLAAAVEGLQLVAFHTGRFGYLYYSGLQLLLVVTPTQAHVSGGFVSQFGIGPAMQVREPFVAIDGATLLVWWLLRRARRRAAARAMAPAPAA
jgi:hypothetical protein